LIVEDDERVRHILRRALTRINLACDEAASIEEAGELQTPANLIRAEASAGTE
jgi:DNA-binding response OmpR family regulator